MITKKQRVILTLAACAFALAALGSVKNPVTRPFQISGHLEGTIASVSLPLVTYQLIDVGEATHGGRYVNRGSTTVNVESGAFTGSGIATVANGDKLIWVSTSGPGANRFTVTWTGGTGRFANVSGGFVATMSNVVIGSTTESFDYQGEGAITY